MCVGGKGGGGSGGGGNWSFFLFFQSQLHEVLYCLFPPFYQAVSCVCVFVVVVVGFFFFLGGGGVWSLVFFVIGIGLFCFFNLSCISSLLSFFRFSFSFFVYF